VKQTIGYCDASDGARIAFATYGGDGPPMLVLSDVLSQEHVWRLEAGRALLTELARDRRLVSYDVRGVGLSDRGVSCGSLDDYGRDIAAVIHHLGLEGTTLFSFGGLASPLAISYAARHPAHVSALILWGALITKKRVDDAHVETFRRVWAWNALAMATMYFPSGPLELERWFAKGLAAASFEDTVGRVMDLEWSLGDLLPRITTPALVLQRARVSAVNPSLGRQAARLLANARLLMLEGDADHPVHDPVQYLPTLRAFLDEYAPSGSYAARTAGTRRQAPPLTDRETEVLTLLSAGATAREIADALAISVSTVQRHIANIYAKIGARGRVDAAAYGIDHGLVRSRELQS
jgi:DNA-binding CsgD family transcriptional regulator/pimeloyl-ACP methyl ester carboxylesterase